MDRHNARCENHPSRAPERRAKPATSNDLPALDAVPWSISALGLMALRRLVLFGGKGFPQNVGGAVLGLAEHAHAPGGDRLAVIGRVGVIVVRQTD